MIPLLTTLSTVQCPHAGTVVLSTSNTDAQVDGGYVLLQTDTHAVAGCPLLTPAGSPTPCLQVRWTSGATQTKIQGVPVLLQTSSGLCLNAQQLPQGAPIVVQTQSTALGQ